MDGPNKRQGWAAAELVLAVGAAAVTAGAGMMYLPAGFIIGGLLMMAGAVLAMLGGDEE